MAETPLIDCLGSGGCLSFEPKECGVVPCNAFAGPVKSFVGREKKPEDLPKETKTMVVTKAKNTEEWKHQIDIAK